MSGKNSSNERSKDEIERLSKLSKLIQMRQEILDIQDRLMDSDIGIVRAAEKDLERLREQFFHENKDMMAPEQYEVAREDFGYFLALVEMAIAYYGLEGYDKDTKH
jgi:hypothetical protein